MAKTRPGTHAGVTTERILDVAEALAQTRGFNGFSYADIAAEVGITKASLHYHFPTKAALGAALVARYRENFQSALAKIAGSSESGITKLREYANIYGRVLGADRMCLCGMFAAEFASLPDPIQGELRAFFDQNEEWLARILEEGRNDGSLQFSGSATEMAGLLTGALEGSMLLARSYRDNSRFLLPVEQLIQTIATSRKA